MTGRSALVQLSICAVLFVCGCDDGGVKRHNLSGTVNFADQPIPYGKISFRPDRSKGGSGPAGHAEIRDGKYSTKKSGKGAVLGPVEVIIEGLTSDKPMAPPLFKPYKTTLTLSSDSRVQDFDVPKEVGFDKPVEVPTRD